MKETGIPVEQPEGAPAKSWANSIKHDPSQLSKAVRDGGYIAGAVLDELRKSREEELFRASQERAQAQQGQEIVSEAASIPRGQDFNLPNADLSGVQETVIAASDKAAEQVNDLRASASAREAKANEAGTGIDTISAARNVAKKELGDKAIVTSAAPGRTYSGKIIGILGGITSPDRSAIQAVSDNHAVLHDIRNISANANLKIGEEAEIAVDEQGYSAVKGMEAETRSQKREQSREGMRR
jgi:2C-methyl-D-erythritol 2,4-cyclodiphosphate synthase